MKVIVQDWIELERGWGIKLDGISLHTSERGMKTYNKKYWSEMPDVVPPEYSKPVKAYFFELTNKKLISQIKNLRNIRLWQHEIRNKKIGKKLGIELYSVGYKL